MKETFKGLIVKILTWEAKRVLKKYKPKVIAITGSVGKTGTKDAVYTALSKVEHARKSDKSFNSEIGVPLTILGLPNAWNSIVGWIENIGEGFILPWRGGTYPEWLILEIGVDRPGDIKRLGWLAPHIVVFTQFPDVPVHVEYFKSPDEVMNEKKQMKTFMHSDGTLVTNADDHKMKNEQVEEGQHKVSYGYSEHAMVKGSDYRVEYDEEGIPTGVSFKVRFQEKEERVYLNGVLGRHHTYPALAAIAVIVAEGKMFADAAKSFEVHIPAPGRMRLLKGINGTTLVDDSYNSSPTAVQAGLNALNSMQIRGRRIVILGDMLELGEFSVREHEALGQVVATTADVFISVGVRMLAAAESALSANARCKRIESFQTSIEALPVIKEIISEGDLVFIKGSQGMRMERIVENLLHDSHTAVKVLCRQDPHWKVRA